MTAGNYMLALFGGIGTPELMVILVVALLLFGPKNLPKIARSLGKSMEEFRRAAREVQDELTHEPAPPPEPPLLAAPPPEPPTPAWASQPPAPGAVSAPAPETTLPPVAPEEPPAHGPSVT